MLDVVKKMTKNNYENLIEIRDHLHKNPELSDQEYETMLYIKKYLELLPHFECYRVLETGILAIIKGPLPGKTIMLRADMDALPITELNDFPNKSQKPGIMHACGHDAHMTILIGVANNLSKLWEQLHGEVRLLFQPAEETTGGAYRMIQEGVLKDVDACFGLHMEPSLEVGELWYKNGPLYASCNTFDIDVKGISAHVARPELGLDAIDLASQLLTKLYNIREEANMPFILSVGSINGGTARNIIADNVHLEGTMRTIDEKLCVMMKEKIEKMIVNLGHDYKTKIEIKWLTNYPVLNNNPLLEKYFLDAVLEGELKPIQKKESLMISEDFAWFNHYVPSYFYNLGCGYHDYKKNFSLHSPYFVINDEVLYYGVLLQTLIAINNNEMRLVC